ncbi:hypothetical protein, partial [Burkholderia stabilis]
NRRARGRVAATTTTFCCVSMRADPGVAASSAHAPAPRVVSWRLLNPSAEVDVGKEVVWN